MSGADMMLHCTDLGSDTDDEDYRPEEDERAAKRLSEEEGSGDEEEGGLGGRAKKGKSRKRKSAAPTARGAGAALDLDQEAREENKKRKEEFEKEKEEKKELREKEKLEDLWADFKKDVKAKEKPKRTGGSGLGSLGMKKSAKTASASSSASQQKPRSIMSSIFDSVGEQEEEDVRKEEEGDKRDEPEASADPSKMTITRVFDFAGENVRVTKEVDKDSSEAKKFLKQQEKATSSASGSSAQKSGGRGGLAGIMGIISGKKPKMGCLDKSKLDWDKFVQEEGIGEELKTHNKGKDGFVEKQEFMERADLRRFELERAAREKTRKPLNR